jgi:hypothetical protein
VDMSGDGDAAVVGRQRIAQLLSERVWSTLWRRFCGGCRRDNGGRG